MPDAIMRTAPSRELVLSSNVTRALCFREHVDFQFREQYVLKLSPQYNLLFLVNYVFVCKNQVFTQTI